MIQHLVFYSEGGSTHEFNLLGTNAFEILGIDTIPRSISVFTRIAAAVSLTFGLNALLKSICRSDFMLSTGIDEFTERLGRRIVKNEEIIDENTRFMAPGKKE